MTDVSLFVFDHRCDRNVVSSVVRLRDVSNHSVQSGCRLFYRVSVDSCRLIRPTATASSRLMISALLVWATALSSSLSIGNDDNDNGHVEELKDSDGSAITTYSQDSRRC